MSVEVTEVDEIENDPSDFLQSTMQFYTQWGFFAILVISITKIYVDIYRYKAATTYYDLGDTVLGSNNFWKFADRLIDYGTLAIFDLLGLFELLSHFGIHSELNVIAWMLATGVGIPIMLATYFGLMIWSYDLSYAANNADGSDGDILQEKLSKDMRNMTVKWVGTYLALTYNAEEWLLA